MSQHSDILEEHYQYPDSDLLKLEVKQTKLPFQGLGLFATAQFQPGQIIAEYYGSILTSQCSESSVLDAQDKLVQIDPYYCVLGRGPASRINDIVVFDPSKYNSEQFQTEKDDKKIPTHEGYHYNAKLAFQDCRKVFIKSTEHIKPNDQILMNYGPNYWKYKYQISEQDSKQPSSV